MGEPTPTLTKRGLRTRDALIAAARTVFERDGFAAARITDIADAAGVAHGTFYTYFESKEQAFHAVVELVREDLLTGGDDGPRGDDPLESIRRANRHYLEGYRRNALMMVIWEQAATLDEAIEASLRAARERFTGRSEAFIGRLQDDGLASPAVDPHYAAHALGAMTSKFAYNWFAIGEDFDFDTAVEQLSLLWAGAVGISTT